MRAFAASQNYSAARVQKYIGACAFVIATQSQGFNKKVTDFRLLLTPPKTT
jgi:hypothetical protein